MLNRVMNRICEFAAFVFLFVGTPWYLWLIAYDLMHPETWDDPLHDPRLYLPVIALVIAFLGWLAWSEHKSEKEIARKKAQTAKVKEFADRVQRLRAEGKWQEANEMVLLYQKWAREQGLPVN